MMRDDVLLCQTNINRERITVQQSALQELSTSEDEKEDDMDDENTSCIFLSYSLKSST